MRGRVRVISRAWWGIVTPALGGWSGCAGGVECGVQEGVEDLPSGQREVGGAGLLHGWGSAGCASAVVRIGQAAEVVDGHQSGGQGELASLWAGGQDVQWPAGAWGASTGWGQRRRWWA